MTPSRIARFFMLAIALVSSALSLAASTPFGLDCDAGAGVMSDPKQPKRVGYITTTKGLGTPPVILAADLRVPSPFQASSAAPSTANTLQVVGIIESFEWNGGAGDPIKIVFYVSQQNALQVKGLQQQVLKSTKVDELGWWIADYDPQAKKWYEQAYPTGTRTISGIITGKENPELSVDLAPVALKNATLYKVSLTVVPGANQRYTLFFANASNRSVVRPWGLAVGTLNKPGSM